VGRDQATTSIANGRERGGQGSSNRFDRERPLASG
jgi:hypothetical protein